MQEALNRGLRTGSIALLAGTGAGVGFAYWLAQSYNKANNEIERQKAIASLTEEVRTTYPRELADRVMSAFERSGHHLAFDFDAEVTRYFNNKLYQFLLFSVGEDFADRLFARKNKFSSYELEFSLGDLLSRTVAEMPSVQNTAEMIEREFAVWLGEDQSKYVSKPEDSKLAILGEIRTNELIVEKRETLIDDSNVFQTDAGIAIIVDDDRVVYISDEVLKVFASLYDFEQANPRNRKWHIVQNESLKGNLVGPHLEAIMMLLYGR